MNLFYILHSPFINTHYKFYKFHSTSMFRCLDRHPARVHEHLHKRSPVKAPSPHEDHGEGGHGEESAPERRGNNGGWSDSEVSIAMDGGTPIAGWFIMENATKMDDDWGYPYFRKPPNGGNNVGNYWNILEYDGAFIINNGVWPANTWNRIRISCGFIVI